MNSLLEVVLHVQCLILPLLGFEGGSFQIRGMGVYLPPLPNLTDLTLAAHLEVFILPAPHTLMHLFPPLPLKPFR